MGKDNLMGLFETQEYISREEHEWIVPTEVKDKVAQMVQKYNERAIKMGYNDSTLNFDASSLTLRGIFVLKTEKTSWLAKRFEDGRNADLSGDVMKILKLCHKVCPQCNSQNPALSKVCEKCGFHFVKDTSEESKNIGVEETEGNDSDDGVENGMGVSYDLFETHTSIEVSDEVVYRDNVLSYFDKFIAAQTAKPKNEVTYFLALDLDKIDPNDLEVMTDNDSRWGINFFDICNIVFSKYNKWMPLFNDKVNSGSPQIFITMNGWQVDLRKVAEVAKKYGISYAMEKGLDIYDREYENIILSFDDDTIEATNFVCYVATNILLVPKDIPITIDISSYQTKAKAQKEYKKNNTFSIKDYTKGAMYLLKDKIVGK